MGAVTSRLLCLLIIVVTTAPASAAEGQAAARVSGGTVLVTGSYGSGRRAVLLDVANRVPTVAWSGVMGSARAGHTASVLHDGTVLIAGGTSSGVTLRSTELYDPHNRSFRRGLDMSHSTVPSVSARRLSSRIQARSSSTAGTVTTQACSVKSITRKMFTVVDQL